MINAGFIKSKIDYVREQVGREVIFYTPNTPLVNTYVNPVTDTSFNQTTTANVILARIHWTNDEQITATPGGKYFVGDCQIHIDPMYQSIAEVAQAEGGKVVVDGHDMSITKIIPVGASSINRIRIILVSMGARP